MVMQTQLMEVEAARDRAELHASRTVESALERASQARDEVSRMRELVVLEKVVVQQPKCVRFGGTKVRLIPGRRRPRGRRRGPTRRTRRHDRRRQRRLHRRL